MRLAILPPRTKTNQAKTCRDFATSPPAESQSGTIELESQVALHVQANVREAQSKFNQVYICGIPPWVAAGGFSEYVRAARYFGQHGVWPTGGKPRRPTIKWLERWQQKWIGLQHRPERFAAWVIEMRQRHAARRRARHAEKTLEQAQRRMLNAQARLDRQANAQPIPVSLSPNTLAAYFFTRKQARAS